MEGGERRLAHNFDGEMRQIFSEFLADVVKFEKSVTAGKRFLISFQQALEFLRRPSIHETSELVQSIIKANETKRVQSYVQVGCVNVDDSAQNVTKVNTSLSGLHTHLAEVKGIIVDLENLMEKAGCTLQAIARAENLADQLKINFSESLEQEVTASDMEAIASPCPESLDAAGSASFMAVIYNMVKQDYVMQEKIVSSLSLKSSTGELDSYCLMWTLRPYVNDDTIHQALRHVT